MPDIITFAPITQTDALAPAVTHHPAPQPGTWPVEQERRRPGRNNSASPELIALMRKPTAEARLRVMLYDAPNFVLPESSSARGRSAPFHTVRMVAAIAACSLVWAVAFRGMVLLWG